MDGWMDRGLLLDDNFDGLGTNSRVWIWIYIEGHVIYIYQRFHIYVLPDRKRLEMSSHSTFI